MRLAAHNMGGVGHLGRGPGDSLSSTRGHKKITARLKKRDKNTQWI